MRNLTSPHAQRRIINPMTAHDKLPQALRIWAAQAALPWSAASVLKIWHRALRDTGCPDAARARLDAIEARMLAKEAPQVWGKHHPYCGTSTS